MRSKEIASEQEKEKEKEKIEREPFMMDRCGVRSDFRLACMRSLQHIVDQVVSNVQHWPGGDCNRN